MIIFIYYIDLYIYNIVVISTSLKTRVSCGLLYQCVPQLHP